MHDGSIGLASILVRSMEASVVLPLTAISELLTVEIPVRQ